MLALAIPVAAQGGATGKPMPGNVRTDKPSEKPGDKTGDKQAKPQLSAAAKAALQAARDTAGKIKGQKGQERSTVLETAAKTYELVAVDFAAEPMAAAQAQFAAAELWRRHGSPAPAEKDYLEAARLDPARFGQRATLEAADMQRRQKQNERALATYIQVVAMDASTSRAQEARIWQARLLQTLGRIDESLAAFATAVEAADRPRAAIEAANWLAKALIQKGDLAAAEQSIAHADTTVANAGEDDPVEVGRLQKALAGMSARKALQRAKDKQNQAGKDARQLEGGKKGDNGPRR